jgi:osmotically-inducible protein OsmY
MKTTSDKSMQEAVTRELGWDPILNADRIGVTARDGAIVLTGHVPAYAHRRAAVKAAERVYGVRAVADDIEVRLPGSSQRDDSDLAVDVARALNASNVVPPSVKGEVNDSHVTLHGDVEWAFERYEAERAIRHLLGLLGVSNLIAIRPQLPTPSDVEHRVAEAIGRMADVDARSVWVTTSSGTVYLHGHVHSLAQRHTAERAAASGPGVTSIENDILVTP